MKSIEFAGAVAAGAFAAAIALAAGSCGGGHSAPARFDESWPSKTRDYEIVTAEWTRNGTIVKDYDKVLQVSATFLSSEWRAAYVSKRTEMELLGDEARAVLTAEQQSASEEYYEVELLVSTYRYEENELQKGDRSMWRIALVDDKGNEVLPADIRRDRRAYEVLRAFFPHAKEFHTPYVARFPRTITLLGDGARKFTLKMASARGGVELVWTAK